MSVSEETNPSPTGDAPYGGISVPHFLAAEPGKFRFLAGYWSVSAVLVIVAYRGGFPWGMLPFVPYLAWVWLRQFAWREQERGAGRCTFKFVSTGVTSAAAGIQGTETQNERDN